MSREIDGVRASYSKSRNTQSSQNRCLAKICRSPRFRRTLFETRLSSEDISGLVLRILDLDLVVAAGGTDFRTADDVEERTAEKDFKGGLLDNLDLKEDLDRTELNRVVFDNSKSHSSSSVGRFHRHSTVRDKRDLKTLPDFLPHDDNLSSSIKDTLGLNSRGEGRVDNTKREAGSRSRGTRVVLD